MQKQTFTHDFLSLFKKYSSLTIAKNKNCVPQSDYSQILLILSAHLNEIFSS